MPPLGESRCALSCRLVVGQVVYHVTDPFRSTLEVGVRVGVIIGGYVEVGVEGTEVEVGV